MPEPGNPQSLNRYSYVLNNPLRYTDPTGMFSEDEIMGYLGVSTWDDVLAMFGESGVMAGAWGFLEVLRQAELGTPISLWFDVGNGFDASQPNMMGAFSEQDGALVFSGAFLDWSGAGGSWTISGLSAVPTSTLLPSTWHYQMGRFGNYLGAQTKYLHLRWDPNQVDWTDVGLGVVSATSDIGIGLVGAGVASGNPAVALVGAVLWGLGTAAEPVSVGKTYGEWMRGEATPVDLGISGVHLLHKDLFSEENLR